MALELQKSFEKPHFFDTVKDIIRSEIRDIREFFSLMYEKITKRFDAETQFYTPPYKPSDKECLETVQSMLPLIIGHLNTGVWDAALMFIRRAIQICPTTDEESASLKQKLENLQKQVEAFQQADAAKQQFKSLPRGEEIQEQPRSSKENDAAKQQVQSRPSEEKISEQAYSSKENDAPANNHRHFLTQESPLTAAIERCLGSHESFALHPAFDALFKERFSNFCARISFSQASYKRKQQR